MRQMTYFMQGMAIIGICWSTWLFWLTLNSRGPFYAWTIDVPLGLVNWGIFTFNGWLRDRLPPPPVERR